MSFEEVVRRYLSKFQENVRDALTAGVASTEMATRPTVHEFIDELVSLLKPSGADVVVHHDTRVGGTRNTPDWWVEDRPTFGVYFYGDHKNLNLAGDFSLSAQEQAQMDRYLRMGRPLFVFDGLEFLFFDPRVADPLRTFQRLQLVRKPVDLSTDWSALNIDPLVEQRFRELMGTPGFRQWSEAQLMEQLASRAVLVADSIRLLIQSPRGSGQDMEENALLDALHDLNGIVAAHHDPSLSDPRACAEFVAQVLVFGLFFAHSQAPRSGDSPADRGDRIADFWRGTDYLDQAGRLKPFMVISELLEKSLTAQNDLGVWYRDLSSLLAHAEYMGTTTGPDDFHALFERFLTHFSNELRFERGAFYTPPPLAMWMAQFSDLVSQHLFGQSVHVGSNKIIDPCCGTGGLLDAVLRVAPDLDDPPEFVGFEVLPAPYALAHYRLARTTSGSPAQERVHIFLTDTLSDLLANPPSVVGEGNGFSEQLAEASGRARPPLQLVIGNPPSSIHVASEAPRTTVASMMEAFRPPKATRSDRQNIQKAINNEAYRFLRWCADRALATERGILALVLPGSFLESASLKFARKWVLGRFHDIWILNLDADARTGAPTTSLFGVQQGRCVLVAAHGGDGAHPSDEEAGETGLGDSPSGFEVRYLDIRALTLSAKQEWLRKSPLLADFSTVDVVGPTWRFAPIGEYSSGLWHESWPLRSTEEHCGIFRLKCSGIKLAPTSVLFHTDQALLLRRSVEIGSTPPLSYEHLRERWFQGQQKPPTESKLTPQVRAALKEAASDGELSLRSYTYRPFVTGLSIVDDRLFRALGAAPGAGQRSRPEIRCAYAAGAIGLAVAPAPADLGETMTRFVAFAWDLPDNDLVARGNAMIYLDRAPEEFRRQGWDDSVSPNVVAEARDLFNLAEDPAETCLYYCYAVMNSAPYLEVFESALYTSANPDDPARVPIAARIEDRLSLADLGRRAAECERVGTSVERLPMLTLDWPSDLTEFRLRSSVSDVDAGAMILEGFDGERVVVSGIPPEVLTLRIAGHDVAAKWMRERTYPYLRRTFTPGDAEGFLDLVSRIEAQRQLLLEVDEIVSRVLDGGDLVAPPSRGAV